MLDIDVKPTCTVPHMRALTDIMKEKMRKAARSGDDPEPIAAKSMRRRDGSASTA